ncbi:hypothetical protein CES86_0465 [Brucella lupini]|uniref:Uncharacterized protein n=1 Tax=Brucella lupini TaxID=255457 RepID=A0A256GYA7_9HYPH|nr:hypothetical protein CES86_0465 [Brucella lupini]
MTSNAWHLTGCNYIDINVIALVFELMRQRLGIQMMKPWGS